MKVFGNKETLSKTASDLKEPLNPLPPPSVNSSLQNNLTQNNAIQGVFDVHVHMGQYFDDYYTPPRILRTLRLAGITHFAYSSTSNVVTDDAAFMREERDAMHELSEGRAIPFLWVTHSMLQKSRDLSLYLDDKIKGLKIHGGSEKWNPSSRPMQRAFDIASERNLAVMLHTGEKDNCFAGIYKRLCQKYSTGKIILAHGRPINQTIDILKNCPNTFVDTAFMPHEHLELLIKAGFADRILFGTDTPIPGRHLKSSLPRYLRSRISTSSKIAGDSWKEISWLNAQRIFN